MNFEPLILAIETATLGGSLALARGRTVLSEWRGEPGVSHSNALLSDVNQMLAAAQVELQDIDLFVVASGPGSFTGLRIGLATVKALSATLNRPSVGIPTLEAVALAGGVSATSVALMPAGRGEVFTQLFKVHEDDIVTPLDEASHIPPAQMLEKYSSYEELLWCGAGALVYQDMIRSNRGTHEWSFAPETLNLARYCSLLGLKKYEQQQLETPNGLRAIYVRPSDAELKV
jgi:tRNA threonylcarbamoyladenosine biosynthesis protein TsaB